jgi:acetolactate synthase-1/2/3 large subunit
MIYKTKIVNKQTGAFALIDSLVRNGVDTIFGYPGGAILPIYDELYFWEKQYLIKHILTRHEQGAIHAADAYARVTGRVGVCFATSGPGATNLVTGIANAQLDSIPMVIITGQVGRAFIGTDAFQETDIFGITLPIVKHSYVIRDPKQMTKIVSEAFYIAQNGRPGPVLIDIPKDVGLEELTEYIPIQQKNIIKLKGYRFQFKTTNYQILDAIKMIKQASQPLLYIGGGAIVSNSHKQILKLAEKFAIPVTTTLMGKGSFNENHPLSLGMLGMHGTAYANFAVSECDLLIAIGTRFDDSNRKII